MQGSIKSRICRIPRIYWMWKSINGSDAIQVLTNTTNWCYSMSSRFTILLEKTSKKQINISQNVTSQKRKRSSSTPINTLAGKSNFPWIPIFENRHGIPYVALISASMLGYLVCLVSFFHHLRWSPQYFQSLCCVALLPWSSWSLVGMPRWHYTDVAIYESAQTHWL